MFPDSTGTFIYTANLQVHLSLDQPNAPRTRRLECVIDSGASRCVFDWKIAESLGIERSACVPQPITGIGGSDTAYLHPIQLYVPGGPVLIQAAFKERLPLLGLLGMNGFFEHFRVTFDAEEKAVELTRIFRA